MKTLDNTKIKNNKVLFRADLNVPFVNNKIIDYSRIKAILASINLLLKNKNKIFIVSHLGRPKGKFDNKYSLKFLCEELEQILNIKKIHFLDNINGRAIKKQIEEMDYGEICLIENIRFYKEEENNDLDFAKRLSENFEYFVNDAFSVSHRNHASITNITKFLPSVAGISFMNEIYNLDLYLNSEKKPNLAIIGGSKISTKIKVLYNLIEIFNTVVIGGAMANTFLLSNNIRIGKSLYEIDFIEVAKDIQKKAKLNNCEIILPIDVVCSNSIKNNDNIRVCNINDILEDHMILDLGKKTSEIISNKISKSRSVLWNGPLGAFEYKPFDTCSINIAKSIKKYSKDFKIETMAGGGDTIAVINQSNTIDGFNYLSNAGGAFLEWLEGNKSPGAIALKKNNF